MSNKIFIVLIVVLVLVACGQGYYAYNLSEQNFKLAKQLEQKKEQKSQPIVKKEPFDTHSWDLFGNTSDLDSWNPLKEMQRMQEEMNSLFGRSFSRFSRNSDFQGFFSDNTFSPRIDIEDRTDEYIITVNLPGTKESNINVNIENGQLQLNGKTETIKKEENDSGSIVHKERFLGSFKRVIPLPDDIDEKNIKREYNDGVLTITIPKLNDTD